MHIYIDADACPVREETYKVARRHKVPVTVVSNSFLSVPKEPLINFIAVSDSFDAADDYICLLYTSPSPRDRTRSRMPSSA